MSGVIAGAIAPGFERVATFSAVEAEHAAIHGGAALIDRSARTRYLFAGTQAAETLTGLVTSDVLALKPDAGQYAAALTPKGKVIADIRIFARAADLLVDVPEAPAPGLGAMLRKFVNPRLAKFADVSAVMRTIGVFGPRARATISAAFGTDAAALAALAAWHHLGEGINGGRALIAAVPDLGVEGFDVFVPVEAASAAWSRLVDAGATPAGAVAADIARVEAGRPLWGVDMDDNTLAAEANFDALGAISYTKGCYTGQETVARVHFRGHVNRSLRGLRAPAVMARGAQLFDGEGQPCGDVRSAVDSPRLGPLAIAMVRRAIPDGADVEARWEGGSVAARVAPLPFPK